MFKKEKKKRTKVGCDSNMNEQTNKKNQYCQTDELADINKSKRSHSDQITKGRIAEPTAPKLDMKNCENTITSYFNKALETLNRKPRITCKRWEDTHR